MMQPTRSEVGRSLAAVLLPYLDHEPVVLALSPGGARVAFEVAQAVEAPLDMMVARPVAVPGRPECVLGAVAPNTVVRDESLLGRLGLPEEYVRTLLDDERKEMERRAHHYRDGMPALPLEGRVAIVVDDGCSAPMVVEVAVRAVRGAGAAHVVFAATRCTPAIARALQPLVDDLALLWDPADHDAPIPCNEHFAQTTAADVQQLIRQTRSTTPTAAARPRWASIASSTRRSGRELQTAH